MSKKTIIVNISDGRDASLIQFRCRGEFIPISDDLGMIGFSREGEPVLSWFRVAVQRVTDDTVVVNYSPPAKPPGVAAARWRLGIECTLRMMRDMGYVGYCELDETGNPVPERTFEPLPEHPCIIDESSYWHLKQAVIQYAQKDPVSIVVWASPSELKSRHALSGVSLFPPNDRRELKEWVSMVTDVATVFYATSIRVVNEIVCGLAHATGKDERFAQKLADTIVRTAQEEARRDPVTSDVSDLLSDRDIPTDGDFTNTALTVVFPVKTPDEKRLVLRGTALCAVRDKSAIVRLPTGVAFGKWDHDIPTRDHLLEIVDSSNPGITCTVSESDFLCRMTLMGDLRNASFEQVHE